VPERDAAPAHIGGAEPVGRVRGEDAGLEHPDREHRREPRALGVLLVVVDRVEVARRALVPHEVRAGERPDVGRLGLRALGEVIPRDAHRPQPSVGGLPVSMAVDRISATTLPASSRNSCTVSTKVIVPPRLPSFSYMSSTRLCAVSFVPAFGGGPWNTNSRPPSSTRRMSSFSDPHRFAPGGAQNTDETRNVGGASGAGSSRYSGFSDFVARANSRTLPRSTTKSNDSPVSPTASLFTISPALPSPTPCGTPPRRGAARQAA